MGIRDAVILVFFVVSSPICFLRPFYGVVLWAIVAFLNPHRFAWSTANTFPVAMIVGAPTLLGFLVFSRDWKAWRTIECFLLVALGAWFTLTSLAAANNPLFVHHIADTWDRWQTVAKILLMTVVTMAVVDSFERLRVYMLVIAGSFGALVLKTLPFMIITRGRFRLYGPNGTMIADNNDFGLALVMTLPLFFFLAQTEEKPWVKRLFGFLFGATILAIFCTYSRGALVGLVTVAGLMILRLKQRLLLIPAAVLAGLVVMLFAPQAWRDRMTPTSESAMDKSARARLDSWAYARNLAADYPITGGGFATFTTQLAYRYARPGAAILGAHSVYFGLLAEHGYVGLMLYLLLVASCLASAHGLVKHGLRAGDSVVVSYANMFRFSLAGFLTSGIFLGRAYFDYFFAIAGCMAILKAVAREEWAQSDLEAEEASEESFTVAVEES